MEIDEKTLLPANFDYWLLDDYLKSKNIKRVNLARQIDVSPSYITDILCGEGVPSIDIGIRISRVTGFSLDELYKNSNIKGMGFLPQEMLDAIEKYLSKETKDYICKTLKEDKSNKYKRLLSSLFATEVDGEYGKETFMQLFTEHILNLLVNAKINDTTFMKMFVESANKLSIELSKYKIQTINSKTDEFTFQEIVDNSTEKKMILIL